MCNRGRCYLLTLFSTDCTPVEHPGRGPGSTGQTVFVLFVIMIEIQAPEFLSRTILRMGIEASKLQP